MILFSHLLVRKQRLSAKLQAAFYSDKRFDQIIDKKIDALEYSLTFFNEKISFFICLILLVLTSEVTCMFFTLQGCSLAIECLTLDLLVYFHLCFLFSNKAS